MSQWDYIEQRKKIGEWSAALAKGNHEGVVYEGVVTGLSHHHYKTGSPE